MRNAECGMWNGGDDTDALRDYRERAQQMERGVGEKKEGSRDGRRV